MSFLKQLLTPFVEFDADQKQTPPAPKSATPASSNVGAPASPANTVAAQPAAVPKPQAPKPTPPKPAQPVQAAASHPLVTPGQPAATPAQVPAFAPSGTMADPLQEHTQYFERLIDEANRTLPMFQGTDFKEFADSKVDIDDITDEALRYKTAFNVLKSTGLTREKLLSTGQEYLNLIGRDMNAFQSAHVQQYNKEVRQREEQIQKKAAELQALTQKINALKADINQLTKEIDATREQLNTTKHSFLLAGERKQLEIDTELGKIAQYF